MTFATSVGSARRFCMVACKLRLMSSGSSLRDIGVLTEPIAVSLQAMTKGGALVNVLWECPCKLMRHTWSYAVDPDLRVFLRAVRESPITAALLAQYAAFPGWPNWPNTLAAETYEHIECHNVSVAFSLYPLNKNIFG